MPVRLTGFGRIVKPRDVEGIAAALTELETADLDAEQGALAARELYEAASVVDRHAALFTRLIERQVQPTRG